jgi:chromosome partitioning protein
VIIALLNQKGGVGKTTLATHVAGELAFARRTVLVIDADPQGSALDWAQIRAHCALPRCFGVMGLARETLHQEVPELAKSADDIVIDGPPRVTALARSAILAAEVVLIPVQPSPYDVWASAEVVSLVTEALIFKPTLRAAFVVNRAVVGTVIGREIRGAVGAHGLPVLQCGISQRIAFAESAATGQLVREIDPHSAATREIAALTGELAERFR